jgi:hypothetical protein
MLRGAILSLTAGMIALGMCGGSFAQDHPAKDPNLTPPATTTAAPAAAHNAAPAGKSDDKDSTGAKPATKPKKVWTNDDMGELHQNSSLSVVGTQKRNSQPNDYSAPPGQSEYMVKMYRQQIDQLQAQADAIDKQILNLQDAKSGKTVDSSRTYDPWGGKTGDWNAQIEQLQKNRDNLLKQIDSIQDQIRKLNP